MSDSPPRDPTLVARLAPSPTGALHLGHARSFLLAWWQARSLGGRVVLRLEDLDLARVAAGSAERCLLDLDWLGLDWDGEPLVQSADPEPYRRAVEALLVGGRAYACVCSRKEIQGALSAPHAGGELRYPGTCRGRYADPASAERESGRSAGVRLRVAPGPVRFRDELRGERSEDVQATVGDFLIARRDGAVPYQLAVVVDDARQGVTAVLRGDDLLPSAARQELLHRALGHPPPRWWHVPLVVDGEGRRLSKRDGDLALASLRESGVDPRAVVAWAARSAGQVQEERLGAAEVLAHFDLARLPLEAVRLGDEELGRIRAARG